MRPPSTKNNATPALPPGCESDTPGTLDLSWLHTPDMGFADVFVDGRLEASIGPADRSGDSDVQLLRVPVSGAHSAVEVVARAMDPEAVKAAVEAASSEDEATDPFSTPAGPVHLLGMSEEHARAGIVFDAVGLPGTTGMTPQRWRQDLLRDAVAQRQYDLVITAWGTNEAGIASLDEDTYRHHFARTLETLLLGSPGADCLVMGPSDRLDHHGDAWTPAPAAALVERVQREVARSHGCAFYSLQRAMGGPGSMRAWVADGGAHPDHVHFTHRGYDRMADFVIDDVLSAYAFHGELQVAAAAPASAQTARAPLPPVSKVGG